MNKRLRSISSVIALTIVLSACGKTSDKTLSSQIAAKVNGFEISVHEVSNSVPINYGNVPPAQAREVAMQTLERLIDQELLMQEALAAKLDQDPRIMQAIEGSKRQILAQAYLENAVAASGSSDINESRTFYSANPTLFEQRRIYQFQELVAAVPIEKLESLKMASAKSRNLDDLKSWFKIQNVAFNSLISTKAAEQIPLDMLQRLSKMKNRQIAVFATPNRVSVIQLLHSQGASLNELQAKPIIDQYLAGRKRLTLVQTEVKQLREKASIEYVGGFDVAHLKASSVPAPPVKESGSMAAKQGDEHLERGLSGLL